MNIRNTWWLVVLPALALLAPSGAAVAAASVLKTVALPHPSATEIAAIRRAAGDVLAHPLPGHSDEPLYTVASADLNDDGRADLIVQYAYATGSCGSRGCSGIVVMATAGGYSTTPISLPNAYDIHVLSSTHHGMHDLFFGGYNTVWEWNGKEYDINRSRTGSISVAGATAAVNGHATATPPDRAAPDSDAQPWKTAQAAGHPMMAYATPIDSTIKRLYVSCRQGQPLLTMLTKAPRPAGPVTLTFVFRGGSVNLPMQRNIYNTNLWMADLSHSDLPLWLAHRGNTATTRKLARAADMAFLRINGHMEGEISLKDSTAATTAALRTCHRY